MSNLGVPSMFNSKLLSGRTALITGGGSGIGLDIASTLCDLGAAVAIVGRDEGKLAAAVAALTKKGASAQYFKADVRDYDQVDRAINGTIERFGALDILVNNAAGNFLCPTAELSPNGWRTVIDIDLNGTFHCCHAAFEHLRRSKYGGSIVSIITMLALSGWPGAAHAAAAKAGILSLSRSLAVEWGEHDIRVNTVSPGPIGDTEGVRRLYVETGRADAEIGKTALGRFGMKGDVSSAVAFLSSDLASFITGDNLIVDGGRWLKASNV